MHLLILNKTWKFDDLLFFSVTKLVQEKEITENLNVFALMCLCIIYSRLSFNWFTFHFKFADTNANIDESAVPAPGSHLQSCGILTQHTQSTKSILLFANALDVSQQHHVSPLQVVQLATLLGITQVLFAGISGYLKGKKTWDNAVRCCVHASKERLGNIRMPLC